MLKDKVALITGSGQGIGRAIALKLASYGANIVVSDVIEDNGKAVCDEIISLGREAIFVKCDVSNMNEVENLATLAMEKFGKIDILVNNAGITRDTLILKMTEEDWDKVIAINLKGTFNCSKVISKLMIKQRSGRIINIASIIGLVGNAGQCNYAASKAGIIGLTKSIAKELALRNITVNAIAPGFIKTKMTDNIPDKIKDELLKQIPLRKLGEPEDVANAVLFLSSDLASYITGEVIKVDGGMVM